MFKCRFKTKNSDQVFQCNLIVEKSEGLRLGPKIDQHILIAPFK